MKKIAFVAIVLAARIAVAGGDVTAQWGQWRGSLGTGVAPDADPPMTWSETENVRWKTSIPGRGHSTPVVWGDRIYLTTAVSYGDAVEAPAHDAHGAHDNVPSLRRLRLVVLAVDRRDGSIVWQKTVHDGRPHDAVHESGTWASASAVTDGKHVIAFFGSGGLYGLDTSGELLWSKELGKMRVKHSHGEGSSPALHGNTVVVNWDHEAESFVVALDKRSGKEIWRVERDEQTSWSSPLIVEHGDGVQVVIAATRRVRGYDLSTGKVIWECGGLSGNVVATPVAADGVVYVANSYETRAMLAIRLDAAKGDITGTGAVAWTRNRDTPYVPSPVLYGGSLCFLKHYQGIMTCVDARTGETQFGPERVPGIQNVYASLVGAAGRIYIVDRGGTTAVIRQGPKFELLASNRLDDSFSASPAIVGDEMFLRGATSLYCLADRGSE